MLQEDIELLRIALKNLGDVSIAGLTNATRDDIAYAMNVIEIAIKAKQRLAEERKAKA